MKLRAIPLPDGEGEGLAIVDLVDCSNGAAASVTALNRGVQRLLRRFLPGPYAFQFFIHDGTNLRHIARAQPFGERQRRLVQHLARRDIGTGVLILRSPVRGSGCKRRW